MVMSHSLWRRKYSGSIPLLNFDFPPELCFSPVKQQTRCPATNQWLAVNHRYQALRHRSGKLRGESGIVVPNPLVINWSIRRTSNSSIPWSRTDPVHLRRGNSLLTIICHHGLIARVDTPTQPVLGDVSWSRFVDDQIAEVFHESGSLL